MVTPEYVEIDRMVSGSGLTTASVVPSTPSTTSPSRRELLSTTTMTRPARRVATGTPEFIGKVDDRQEPPTEVEEPSATDLVQLRRLRVVELQDFVHVDLRDGVTLAAARRDERGHDAE